MNGMMTVVPIDFDEAARFVKNHHRHHLPPLSHKFSVALARGESVVGVAIVGRPVSRMLQDGWTLEVSRVATDGTKNACSMLYSRCWRIAQLLGYRRVITYILDTEHGASLNAAGWRYVGKAGGGSWNCKSRPRVDKAPTQGKIRYEKTENDVVSGQLK